MVKAITSIDEFKTLVSTGVGWWGGGKFARSSCSHGMLGSAVGERDVPHTGISVRCATGRTEGFMSTAVSVQGLQSLQSCNPAILQSIHVHPLHTADSTEHPPGVVCCAALACTRSVLQCPIPVCLGRFRPLQHSSEASAPLPSNHAVALTPTTRITHVNALVDGGDSNCNSVSTLSHCLTR